MNGAADELAQLRGWIGKREAAQEALTLAAAERFHHTLELSGPPAREGEAAPRLIHFCLAQPAAPTTMLGSDGHIARGGFLPPIPMPRRMWAASELRFFGDIRVGEAVRRQSEIADVVVKSGSTGTLYFVTVDHRIEANGILRVTDRQTIVYRDNPVPGGAATVVAAPAPAGDDQRTVAISPPLLFRYSALTFNTHRIHYDRPYAVEQEGYPGLVVHGPLQATLLFHFAADLAGGAPPDRFSFRGVSPVFDFDEVCLAARKGEDGQMKLWTARADGPVAMRAEATWS